MLLEEFIVSLRVGWRLSSLTLLPVPLLLPDYGYKAVRGLMLGHHAFDEGLRLSYCKPE